VNHWERQYNPRSGVENPQQYFSRWQSQSAEARATLGGELGIAYGEHPRERLDLFRASTPRGTLVFLHGGYWRAFGREDFSWVAPAFVRAGITVAIPSYPLAPEASLTGICAAATRALEFVPARLLNEAERARYVIVGHSAGAHLASHYYAHPGAAGARRADACLGISGIYDLAPLGHSEFLGGMGWEVAERHALSTLFATPPASGRFLLAVGAAESREFHRQSERLAEAWPQVCPAPLEVPGRDHFSVLEALCEPAHPLARLALAQFGD
jgi:arylformamidase